MVNLGKMNNSVYLFTLIKTLGSEDFAYYVRYSDEVYNYLINLGFVDETCNYIGKNEYIFFEPNADAFFIWDIVEDEKEVYFYNNKINFEEEIFKI